MRKLVIAIAVFAVLGLAAPPAQASTLTWVELGFNVDGAVYDNPYGSAWAPPTAVFSSNFLSTGLGTVTYMFSTPGTHYVAGFFDYYLEDLAAGNGIFDEEADWGTARRLERKEQRPLGPQSITRPRSTTSSRRLTT